MANAWTKTRGVLQELENLFHCSFCDKEVRKPCTLGSCEHFFCRDCVERHVHNKCSVCGVPSHVKDIQSDRQLSSAVAFCKILDKLLVEEHTARGDDDENKNLIHEAIQEIEPVAEDSSAVNPQSQEDEGFPSTPAPPEFSGRTRKGKKRAIQRKKVVTSNDTWDVGGSAPLSQCNSCQKNRPDSKSVRFPLETDPPLFEDVVSAQPLKEGKKTYGRKRKGKKSAEKKTEEKSEKVDEITKTLALESKSETSEKTETKKAKKQIAKKAKETSKTSAKEKKIPPKKSPHTEVTEQPWLSPDEDGSPTLQKKVPRKGRRAEVVTPMRSKVLALMNSSITSSPAISKKNPKGETPLHVAVIKGDIDRVTTLLSEGAVVNTKDNAGWTPLHEACNHGNTEVAALLLENGAVINTPGLGHDTPLHDAVANNRLDCVQMLVSRGALLNSRNIHGRTPLDVARTSAMKNILTRTETDPDLASKTETVLSQELADGDVVVIATGLSREERNKLQKCVQMMHGQFVEDYSNRVTHIVTSVNADGLCPRTMKFLKGILGGRWIVNFDWISTCEEYKSRVSEEPFEVPGASSSPFSHAPDRARVNATLQLPGLFSGLNFYLQGNYEYPTPTKEEMYSLIKMADGIVLSREPKPDLIADEAAVVPFHSKKANSQSANYNYFVVLDNKAKKAVVIKERICHVPASYLMDCIAYFELLDLPL